MKSEIFMNVTPRETRVALVEHAVVQEVQIERSTDIGIVGNIYKGRVDRVLPGMQSAFIDIGLGKNAFIHSDDLREADRSDGESLRLTDVIREGTTLMVQVKKGFIGTKGARLTTRLTIPSRLLVLCVSSSVQTVSARIESSQELERLRRIAQELAETYGCGFIIRTEAEDVSEDELKREAGVLVSIWKRVQADMASHPVGSLIFRDLSLPLRTIRDRLSDEVSSVQIDSRQTYCECQEFAGRYIPAAQEKIMLYCGDGPIFELYSIEDEIRKALVRKVELKSGGYLIFDQTEALTTIDVNTGGYIGGNNFEQTIFTTNLEAARAIARQLRLRNIGGIVIIDFIDMKADEHKAQLIRTLEKYLEPDKAKARISGVSPLGLVEMTRKRTHESLEHVLAEECPTCKGRGFRKTAETICYEVFRDIIRLARQFPEAREFLVLAPLRVIEHILEEESDYMAELEQFIKTPVRLQAEALYISDKYDVVIG
jgi:ribonuclease G